MPTSSRKNHHLDLCLNHPVDQQENYFDHYHFQHNALPEIDFATIDTSTEFLGKKISAPLIISSMTGGTTRAQEINERLAKAAEKHQIPMGVGSQRAMVEDTVLAETFNLRKFAPTIPLLANLGAVQLNYDYGIAECQRVVEALQADALCLHLNPFQEAIQPEGNTNFTDLLRKIEAVVKALHVPVIVKEVGCGISGAVARKLYAVGVKIIDVSGRGGTSWAYIEGKRREQKNLPQSPFFKEGRFPLLQRGGKRDSLGKLFANWGIPTPQAIEECAQIEGLTIIAGGGVRSGLDITKAIALGASYGSMALPFLQAAVVSEGVVGEVIAGVVEELRVGMFGVGVKNLSSLNKTIILIPEYNNRSN